MTDLYEKYEAIQNRDAAALNPLNFILRKAEIGKDLTSAEREWLEQCQLKDTIRIIESQEAYRNSLTKDIRRELTELRCNWAGLNAIPTLPNEESAEALILYKANALESLTDFEARLVRSDYNRIREINIIKRKHAVIEDIPFSADAETILRKVDCQAELFAADIEWLYKHSVYSIVNLREIRFSELQEKYEASASRLSIDDTLRLWFILQKLEERKMPTEDEKQFLQKNSFTEPLAVAKKIEFCALKVQYRGTDIQDDTPTHHLYGILKKIDAGLLLPEPDINYLRKRNLHETVKFAFKADADRLRQKIDHGYNLTLDDTAWCRKYHFEEIIFLSLKHDFGVNHREDTPDSPLFEILTKLGAKKRLSDDEVAWLVIEKWCCRGYDERYVSKPSKISIAHHTLEALFFESEYQRTKSHWNLASASAQWRKADRPDHALKLTDDLNFELLKPARLRAALLTTRGGALRDMIQLEAAELCALRAIKHYPDSHNPYTLMGALCYDTGRYSEGFSWFEDARKRGATERDEYFEIKRILSKTKNRKLIDFLLNKDPHRFAWVRKFDDLAKPRP